jgi:O-6-methylguanine DNA methyltransferase
MRTRTRRGEGEIPRRVVVYETSLGRGSLALAGDLPVALALPSTGRAAGATDECWSPLLERYFAGDEVVFPLDVERHIGARRLTPFEGDVIRALARVPYGVAVSYGDLARAAGHPRAWRAVGTVMAGNELPVILPCHRVVRSDGALGRYGDDPAWKARLLALEGVDMSVWRDAS